MSTSLDPMACWCGVTFTPTHRRQRNCTPECSKRKAYLMRIERRRKKIRRFRCARLACRKRFLTRPHPTFPGPDRVFCCDRCQYLANRKVRREMRKMRAKLGEAA